MNNAWEGFKSGLWETTINVDDFINVTTLRMTETKVSWQVLLQEQQK